MSETIHVSSVFDHVAAEFYDLFPVDTERLDVLSHELGRTRNFTIWRNQNLCGNEG